MNYNYHLEISELLDEGHSYEQAVALCESVFGGDENEENHVNPPIPMHLSPMAIRFKNTPKFRKEE